MPKLTVEDFEGLSIPKLTKKLEETEDINFLSDLEEWEKNNEDRSGALKAINYRQGILIDKQQPEEKTDESKTETSSDEADQVSAESDANDEEDTKGDSPAANDTSEQAGEIEVNEEEEEKTEEATPAEAVKNLRRHTNHLVRCCDAHLRIPKEVSDKLIIGRSWMGVFLGETGNKNPYDVEVKHKKDIPALAEAEETMHMKREVRQFSYKNHLDALVAMRDMMDELEKEWFSLFSEETSHQGAIARTQAWVNIREAKFLLGMELGHLRNSRG